MKTQTRPVALITGASRKIGIGASTALALASAGWDVATTYWRPYDAAMPWGSVAEEAEAVVAAARACGGRALALEADLALPETPARLFDAVEAELGPVTALVLSHCQSVDSGLLDTTIESFDLHFAVNARATWLLVREFGVRYRGAFAAAPGGGRIVSLTSDHTAYNLPYGASKGAMDRIVLAAAREYAALGITANVINPGPTDTGWMTPEALAAVIAETPLARVGLPQDVANLVSFLCSAEGGWINGQLLYSNGGIKGPGL